MEKKSVGIVGLGVMGSGMASNFLKHGHKLYVWNRTSEKSISFEKKNAVLCKTPREVAEKADVVFEVTADDESSREVWTGDTGILLGATSETVVIASATLSVEWIDELIGLCKDAGAAFFDIPLTGGRTAAESGTLRMLVGGDKEKLEELKPTLESISSKIYYFGPEGHGMRYKLVLNMLQGVHIAGFGEAMKMAKAANMDLQKVADALADRPGGEVTQTAGEGYFEAPDPVNFMVRWMQKDLKYAKWFSESLETPLLDDVHTIYEQAVEEGSGDEDWTSVAGPAD